MKYSATLKIDERAFCEVVAAGLGLTILLPAGRSGAVTVHRVHMIEHEADYDNYIIDYTVEPGSEEA